jgi:hypothetical protein
VITREQGACVTQPGGNDIEDAAGEITRDLLFQPGDRSTALAEDLAAIWRDAAIEQLHDRTFARTISPQETHPLAPVNGEGGGVQDQRSAKRHTYFAHSQQGHWRTLKRDPQEPGDTE